jgi:hypothetical protein
VRRAGNNDGLVGEGDVHSSQLSAVSDQQLENTKT